MPPVELFIRYQWPQAYQVPNYYNLPKMLKILCRVFSQGYLDQTVLFTFILKTWLILLGVTVNLSTRPYMIVIRLLEKKWIKALEIRLQSIYNP